MSGYQVPIDEARFGRQVSRAMKTGYAETPTYNFETAPGMLAALRAKCIEAVYAYWNAWQRPATLHYIWNMVQTSIMADENWKWYMPLKRTVDRRVNECADPRFGRPTALICTKAGEYIPQPLRFEGMARVLLERLCDRQ